MEDILVKKLKNFESIIIESLKYHELSIVEHAKKLETTETQETSKTQETQRGLSALVKEGLSALVKDDWHNWAGNIVFTPNKILHPKSVEDLKNYVKDAQKHGKKIRCAAEGHSWSTLSVTKDYLVVVNNLDKVFIEKRNDGYVARVEAGAQISQIDTVLRNHDPPLTITSMTVLDSVRIGGVVATGCHGARTESRTIVDQVVGFQIVTSDGELREFSDEINRDEMAAARVNLGLLGIIYTVTIRVEPMYDLRMVDTHPLKSKFDAAALKNLVLNSDGIEIFYWPFNSLSKETDKLWVKQWTKSADPVTLNTVERAFHRVAQYISTQVANDFYQELITAPEDTPTITRWAGKVKLIERNQVWSAPEAIHYQAGIDNIPCEDLEFAIKVDKDFQNIITELDYIFNRIYDYSKEKKFPINLVVEMRITKSSNATLSIAYDEDPDAYYCFLEVLSVKDTPYFKEFSAELAQRWMQKYNARPHWAKHWEYVPNVTEYLHEQLGDRIKKFEAVRVKYDPNNMFFDNESLKRVFYGTN